MKRHRRLRKLTPNPELFRRRATGATLRELALDYGVSHTALSRYFARPEAREQLRQTRRQLRAEQRAAAAQRQAEQRLERDVRRKASLQAALDREQLRHSRAVEAKIAARRPDGESAYAAWLDEHDRRRPLTRAELYSRNDDTAARIVDTGGGIQEVVEATGLRTRENVLGLIDPAILVRAFHNDAADRAAAEPDRDRLRRLIPDRELVRRRAQGETLRRLARDYRVAHTTLGRYFARPQVAKQLKQASRQQRTQPPPTATAPAARKR